MMELPLNKIHLKVWQEFTTKTLLNTVVLKLKNTCLNLNFECGEMFSA
jgi:hypothetical protein